MASKFDHIITKYWQSEADRRIARTFVEKFGDLPGMSDRVSSLLQEAARSAEQVGGGVMSPEDARAYLASFASEGLGMAPHLMSDLTSWFDGTAAEVSSAEAPPQPEAEPAQAQPAAQPAPAKPAQPAQPTAAAPPQPAAPTREALQERIALHQRNMKAPEGSPEWKAYWREGGSADYLAALQAMDTAETPTAPGDIAAGGAPVPAPA